MWNASILQSVAGVLVIIAIWMTSSKPSENVSEEAEVEKMMPLTSVKTQYRKSNTQLGTGL